MRATPRSRRLRDRLTAVVAALGVASLAAGFLVVGTASTAQAGDDDVAQGGNVWVCKYVGKPIVGEEAHHVIPQSAVDLGEWFQDGQEWSIAVMLVTNPSDKQEAADAFELCPPYNPPITQVTAVAPAVVQSTECDVEGTYTIPVTTGVQYLLDEVVIAAGTYDGPEEGEITAAALSGYALTNPDFSFRLDVDAADECETPSHRVTALNPTVVQSTRCEVEGSYTIPATEGVQYLLDGKVIAAGTYAGPKTGTITAEALHSYKLVNEDFSFALNVAPAATCPPPYTPPPVTVDVCSNIDGDQAVVPDGYTRDAQTNICTQVPVPQATAVEPEAVQSEACEVEGSYTIPATAGVQYLLDGVEVEAGTYDGPVDGVLTAAGVDDTVLTNPDFEHMLVVEAAEDCPAEVLPTEAVDVCPNLPGDQEAVPNGYEMDKGKCVQIEKTQPKPPAEQPDEVLGTEAAVPTEVDAGLVGPTNTTGGPSSPVGQALMGAGLMLLVLAGTMQAGRRERGVHEA